MFRLYFTQKLNIRAVKIISLFLILIPPFVKSCTQDEVKIQPIYNIDIRSGINNLIDSSIIESITYLPLLSDSLFGSIDKIIFSNNMIYLLDKKISKTISVFDKEGNLISYLNKYGRGPEEYSSLSDIFVDDDGNINVFDNLRKKILVYNELGKFLFTTKVNFNCYGIASTNKKGTICLYRSVDSRSVKDVLSLYYIPERKTKSLIKPRKKIDILETPLLTKNYLYSTDSSILFNNYFSNTIYKIDSLGLIPFCEVSMKNIPLDDQESLGLNPLDFIEKSKHEPFLLKNIFESENVITFSYNENDKEIFIFYSKKTGKVIYTQYLYDDRFFGNMTIEGIKNNKFITYLDPSLYTKDIFWDNFLIIQNVTILNKSYIKENKSDIKLILVMYTLKEF